jgi:hypothetical protein
MARVLVDRNAEIARAVGEMPHIRSWMDRLRVVARAMPKEVWVFVASGKVHVMARGADGQPVMASNEGVDPKMDLGSVPGGLWDGGDW